MKTLLLIALLPSLALAQAPSDAPLADIPGTSVRLATGQPAPFPGRLLSEPEQVRREKVNEFKAAEGASLKKGNVTVSVPVVIAIVAGAVVAGAAAGFGIAKATQPKP